MVSFLRVKQLFVTLVKIGEVVQDISQRPTKFADKERILLAIKFTNVANNREHKLSCV